LTRAPASAGARRSILATVGTYVGRRSLQNLEERTLHSLPRILARKLKHCVRDPNAGRALCSLLPLLVLLPPAAGGPQVSSRSGPAVRQWCSPAGSREGSLSEASNTDLALFEGSSVASHAMKLVLDPKCPVPFPPFLALNRLLSSHRSELTKTLLPPLAQAELLRTRI